MYILLLSFFAHSTTYNCLNNFHDQFIEGSKKRKHIEGYEIRKIRVRKQNVIVANLVDPLDDKSKKLFVTKEKARVCDPSAETGRRCVEPQERHVNATLGRHISILPEMYRDSLNQYKKTQQKGDRLIIPDELLKSLGDCKKISKTLKKKILMKSKAITVVYQGAFAVKKQKSTE